MQVLQAAPALAQGAASLAPAVSPVLADALAKAAVRSEGVAALLALTSFAAADCGAAAHCDSQKVC